MRNPLNGKTWPIVVAFVGLFGAFAMAVESNQSPAITFGNSDQSYLKLISDKSKGRPLVLPAIAPGDRFQVCFEGISWYRIAPSVGSMWFYDANGLRRDLDVTTALATRQIPLPPSVGPANPKCRPEIMPDVSMPEGLTVLTGSFTSTDSFFWRTRIVTLPYPRMPFLLKTREETTTSGPPVAKQ